jgi:hypothetical protein
MPAKIRVRCKAVDCKFIDDAYCTLDEIEMDKKNGCASFLPVEAAEVEEEDSDLEEGYEEESDEDSWDEMEEEEDDDGLPYEDE